MKSFNNPNIENKTTLEITIDSVEFAKDMNYFVTIQLDGDGEKRRTKVSEKEKKPKFENSNKFYLPLKNYQLMINQQLIFGAFTVVDHPENNVKSSSNSLNINNNNISGKGKAQLLGEAILELAPLTKDLVNIQEIPVKQRLEFLRRQGDNIAVVGRMNITLHLLAQQIENDDELIETGYNDGVRLLPNMDILQNFVWRMRVDVRSAVNLPFNHTTESKLPSCYVEMGWTMYPHKDINMAEATRSAIVENNRFPIWNHQVLYYPPSNVQTFDGFFNVYLKDKYQSKPIQKITFPINTLKPYHPVHLDFMLDTEDEVNRSRLFISFTLEDCPEFKLSDSLVNVLIHNINFDPLPKSTNRVSVMMTTEKLKPTQIEYKAVEMKSDSHLVNVLIAHKTDPYSIFLTNTQPIPINKSLAQNQFGSIASFILPRSFLDKNLTFFLIVRDHNVICNHSMPNTIAGLIDVINEDLLKTSYFSKTHDIIRFRIIWYKEAMIYKSLCHSRCDAEFSVRPITEIKDGENTYKDDPFNYEEVKNKMIKNTIEDLVVKLPSIPDNNKWDILSKELSQKQELIHKFMVELEDKKDSLKRTGEEILEQRKKIRLLQNENTILKKRLGQEETLHIESLVTAEIHKMSLPELKSKIIKLSQTYRAERLRNEEYERMLKNAQNEISNARKLGQELEDLQKQHEKDSEKYLNLQRETQKLGLYRETIMKQEEVIEKTENILKKKLNEVDRLKKNEMEMEQLRTENLKLQKELKDLVVNTNPGLLGRINPELEKYKKEVNKLENLVKELQAELKNKRPISAEKHDVHSNILDLEVKLHKANARVAALEEEIKENSIRYSQEIARLKMILSEKESIIETLRIENAI